MKTNRIDNFWKTPRPNFLNKVAIYNVEPLMMESIDPFDEEIDAIAPKTRRSKCSACTPTRREGTKVITCEIVKRHTFVILFYKYI